MLHVAISCVHLKDDLLRSRWLLQNITKFILVKLLKREDDQRTTKGEEVVIEKYDY